MSDIHIDFEFLEDGKTIDPISVGIAGPDGREYYAVNVDADWPKIFTHPFLAKHVCPHLPMPPEVRAWWRPEPMLFNMHMPSANLIDRTDATVKPKWVIANEARDFIRSYPDPVLWGDEPCFDHVALAWLYGDMTCLPKGIPFSTFNIQQELYRHGNPNLVYDISHLRPHHALDDARASQIIHKALLRHEHTRPRIAGIPTQEPGCPT